MKRSEVILMVLQVPLDFLMLILAGISAYYLRFTDWAIDMKPVVFEMSIFEFMDVMIWVALGWIVIFAILNLYSIDPNRKFARDLARVVFACSVGLAAIAVYIVFTQQLFDSRFLVAAGWGFAVFYVGLGRFVMRGIKSLLYRGGIGLRRIVIIGSEEIANNVTNVLKRRRELGYDVVATFGQYSKKLDTELKAMHINEIIFTNPRADEEEALAAMQFCNQNHIVFKYSADVFATYSANMSVTALAGVPIVELRRTSLDGWGRVGKRIFDIIVSILVIVLLSPILLIAALIILLETGRPIIYKNERVGIRGRRFFTFKFRSMYKEDSTGPQFGKDGERAEEKEQLLIKKQNSKKGPIYKIQDDPRVTRFGRFIRRWSVDELPQFFNVIKGEMSIVGPRPHQPREVEKYEKRYPIVFTLKPGITGLAQISGRSDLSFEEEMKLDILYTERWSLLQDVVIFIKTPFIVFKKRKAL
ncbi:hypothetical protein C0581_02630 [Candidatus Parcubacteria bacterium]|nr:MAG: hypothetical protein C0581_02630 [Candidatus Parcubacteria bacterium]